MRIWARLGYRSALNSTRRDIEGPGKDERNRETGQDEDRQTQAPVWQVPGRKNRRGDLNEDAARDDVGDGHAVNFSALQFLKEAAHNKRLTECEGNASMHSFRHNNTDMLNAVLLYTPSCHLLKLPPDSDTTASQLAITMT